MRFDGIAVIVPMHNEAERIGDTLAAIVRHGGARLGPVVVIDDGSTDGSAEIAARQAHHVERLAKNAGNGAATRAGLRWLQRHGGAWSAVVRLDGDGQHDPSLLPDVFARLDAGADAVVCSRFHPEADRSHAMIDRRLLNDSAALWMRNVTGWPVSDARSGFFCFRRSVLEPVIAELRTERYGIPMELLLRVWRRTPSARFVEIPHPAMYQRGISRRLDAKYATETPADRVARMTEAFTVFLETCDDLELR